ncbi:MAG: SsrA-binding protein SmpB [Oscillospiraceae bacterium]
MHQNIPGGSAKASGAKNTKDAGNIKNIAENRQARHNYFVVETLEAGIELVGTEVKSLRAGGVNLRDSWCAIDDGEMFVKGMHISPYEKGNIFNRDPWRERKLLLHKKQILKLFGQVRTEGLTLIPLKLYFKNSRVKLILGVCKGKKLYDKRDDSARKDADREIARVMKDRRAGG